MEIAPAPPRHPMSARARVLLVLGIFAPVTLLALLPTVFGLQRYVVTSDSASAGIERGSVVFERRVPVSDLRVGDVITYRGPTSGAGEDLVTHRIAVIEGSHLQTRRGDVGEGLDPWLVPIDQPTMPRVVLALPYVGYPFMAPIGRSGWLVVLLVPGTLLAYVLLQEGRRGRPPQPTVRDRVGCAR